MRTDAKWRLSWALAAGSALLAGSMCRPALAQGPYHVQDHWKVGGEGGWDYLAVDPVSHLLYLTRGNHVMVVDSSSGKVTADIAGLKGTHGVAFDTAGKEGFISDGAANQVVVFDRKTNKATGTIPAGTNPDGILYEPTTHTVWAFNGRSKNATVIDAANHSVVATVPLPGKPEFPATDGKGSVYVNIEDTNQIVHLDAKSHKVLGTWPVSPCDSPSGLAIDTAHQRLFAVCDGKKMAVVDTSSGKVVATPEIGDGPDAAGFDSKTGNIFSSNGDGTLTVVHQDSADKYTVVENLPTAKSARTMALDSANGKIYLVAAQLGPRPAATAANPHPRPAMTPNTFEVIVVGK